MVGEVVKTEGSPIKSKYKQAASFLPEEATTTSLLEAPQTKEAPCLSLLRPIVLELCTIFHPPSAHFTAPPNYMYLCWAAWKPAQR